MIKFYNELKNQDLVFLAIDIGESETTVKNYANAKKLPFPVLMDTDKKVARDYGVIAHPVYFLIDARGELIGQALGAQSWTDEQWHNLLRYVTGQVGN